MKYACGFMNTNTYLLEQIIQHRIYKLNHEQLDIAMYSKIMLILFENIFKKYIDKMHIRNVLKGRLTSQNQISASYLLSLLFAHSKNIGNDLPKGDELPC